MKRCHFQWISSKTNQSLLPWKTVYSENPKPTQNPQTHFTSRSYIIMGFSPSGKTFECISKRAGRESVAFKNVENYLEPEYLSLSNVRKNQINSTLGAVFKDK